MTLSELKSIAERATPGPWENTPMLTVVTSEEESTLEFTGIPIVVQNGRGSSWKKDVDADCKFIATFNPALILQLLSDVEKMRGALNKIACWKQGKVVASHFDCPGDASLARLCLASLEVVK